jgi:hypothetical protein
MVKDEMFRYDMFIRVGGFGVENTADFPAGSIGATQFAEVALIVAEIQQLIGDQSQSRSDARYHFNTKDTARENLRSEMSDMASIARSMIYQFPGIDLMFRAPRNMSDANLLAAGRAFYDSSAQYAAAMIEYGLPTTFRADLLAAVEEFEGSLSAPGMSIDAQVAATADIGAVIRRGMVAVRILEGVVRAKYRNDVGKLAAWTSASHIERTAAKIPPIPLTV